jgi:Rrf2 family protein
MLSVTTQYALRALAQLAKNRKHRSMLGKDLAERAAIPPNYLAKILLSLKNAGVLGTARGSRGGYWLVRAPEQIRLIDIVQIFDQMPTPQPSVLGERDECLENDPCMAHERWNEIRKSYMDFLQVTTIADLASTKRRSDADQIETVAVSKTNA